MSRFFAIPQDSPVERRRKEMSCGNTDWPQWDYVYSKLAEGAARMGSSPQRCTTEHVDIMAAMGSGDEETMKYYMHWLRTYGWIQ